MAERTNSSRYAVLDSYRALAALYVVAFHYFYRWTGAAVSDPLLPDVSLLSSSRFVAWGELGVEFFFIISGFVIALTLRSTSSFAEFVVRRFARLFPAMLICSVTTFVFVLILDVDPFADVSAVDFLPSLTFMSPSIYNKFLGIESDWISGVYWSLFVEVKFYFFAALVYFISAKNFLRNYFLLSVVICILFWTSSLLAFDTVANISGLVFYPKYAGLFLAGIVFQQLSRDGWRSEKLALPILAIAVIYTLVLYSPLATQWRYPYFATMIVILMHVLFALFVSGSKLVRPFDFPWLARIGAASYSLYLLHESIGVPAIYRLNEAFGESIAWSALAVALVIGVSIAFYDYVETPARRLIRQHSSKFLSHSG